MRRKAVTIRDVAKHAGVAISTVSYVLNGHDQHVGTDTRDKILSAVQALNYRPNAIARSMVKQQTATIGLIITELQNPLFVPVTVGVEEVLQQEGYHILLASVNDLAGELSAIETFRSQQVAGIIFMSLSLRYDSDHLSRLREEGYHFVVINRDLVDTDINQIQFDDFNGSFTVTKHLIELGHTRIGMIRGPLSDNPITHRRSSVERYRGWRQALYECNLTPRDEWIAVGHYTYEGGYRAVQQVLQSPEKPTAFVVSNESMAVGMLKGIYDLGLRVPQDIAVATIGDPPFVAYTIPALTTMSIPIVEAGRIAAKILVSSLQAGKPSQSEYVKLGFDLIIRESCGAKAGADS